ncbi:uroporphyrinogen decarboxylase family protein [Irregularibacter muris]|uniref:Uroporphyrinogen decarboxylase family protein n=1 Tax=Irregularibacter muris TaxID=1796619 RepID=A0AAE3HJ91_9FIRM|nr:uroporphyrinogen decarboxylase family protein [Irregularibacter muris]MCR1899708.1 uroporphyrinogen decarboxylase family protein [Irregularibacter muris]
MKKDQMTPKERMTAFSKGLEIDRIPCVPDMGVTMAPFIGATTYEYYHSAELMADLEIALFKRLRHDSIGISTTLRGVAGAMGSVIGYPKNNISYLISPAAKTPGEIENLKPANPETDGILPLLLKALRIIRDTVGHEADVGASMSGPFSVAASLVGTENLLRWMIKYPQSIHTLMEIITESNNRYIEKVAELGLGIGFADPVSSTSLISPKQFDEFSMPYLKKNVDKIRELTGSRPSIHICGTSKSIWESVLSTGIGNFSIDNIEDLEEAKESIGDRVVITGNIPPVEVVHKGTREDILRAGKKCIQKAYDSTKGFILSTGCQIPMHTPMENIEAIMDAARIYGSYPIDEELLFREE